MDGVHDAQRLKELQALPLDRKIQITQARIIEFYQHYNGQVYIAFSGGKDSTVLLHLVRQLYPDVKAVFSNTGLEFPEIQSFVRSKDNVEIIHPKLRFDEIITKYGYPIVGKEVAEAIHYARRISLQAGNVEREREREPIRRAQLRGADEPSFLGYDRSEKTPCIRQNKFTRERNWGWQTCRAQTSSAKKPRSELLNKYGRVGVANQTGGVFSQNKSIFNKEKWLPLAQEAPFLISHYCCNVMKKQPSKIYQRATKSHPYIGTLAEESRVRKQAWMRHGCNAFDSDEPKSVPLSFWTEQDILNYILKYGLDICSVYGDIVSYDDDGNEYLASFTGQAKLHTTGETQTGCAFCLFGAHLEKKEEGRFVRLRRTHPKQYDFCMRGGQWSDNPHYVPDAPEYDGEWKNWNPQKIWTPGNGGLGLAKVIDIFNEMYPKNQIKY